MKPKIKRMSKEEKDEFKNWMKMTDEKKTKFVDSKIANGEKVAIEDGDGMNEDIKADLDIIEKKIKKRRKDSKEVIQKMREWDALPIEEKLKKIEEMKKKGLKVYGEEGDDIIDEEFPKFNDVVSSKRLRKDVLKDREEYYKNIKDNGWDDPIEYSDFDDYLQNEINEMRNETTKGKKMKKEIKREYALMIAGEGGGTELLRVYYEDGTSQFMDERSRLNGASNVLLDDDDIRYDHVDVYFDTFDDYWDRMFPKNDGWWNLGFFTKTEDVYVLVKEKFISELSKLNFSSHDIELITNNRVNRDFGKIK